MIYLMGFHHLDSFKDKCIHGIIFVLSFVFRSISSLLDDSLSF